MASTLSESPRAGTGSGQRRALLTLARKERSREVRGGAGAVEGWGVTGERMPGWAGEGKLGSLKLTRSPTLNVTGLRCWWDRESHWRVDVGAEWGGEGSWKRPQFRQWWKQGLDKPHRETEVLRWNLPAPPHQEVRERGDTPRLGVARNHENMLPWEPKKLNFLVQVQKKSKK